MYEPTAREKLEPVLAAFGIPLVLAFVSIVVWAWF